MDYSFITRLEIWVWTKSIEPILIACILRLYLHAFTFTFRQQTFLNETSAFIQKNCTKRNLCYSNTQHDHLWVRSLVWLKNLLDTCSVRRIPALFSSCLDHMATAWIGSVRSHVTVFFYSVASPEASFLKHKYSWILSWIPWISSYIRQNGRNQDFKAEPDRTRLFFFFYFNVKSTLVLDADCDRDFTALV